MNLYLTFEGVLHPIDFPEDAESRAAFEMHRGEVLEQGRRLEKILECFPGVRIVLNTWWVYHLGASECRKMLPRGLATRVVGSVLVRPARWESLPDRVLTTETHIIAHGLQQSLVLDHIHARYSKAILSRALLLPYARKLSDAHTADAISTFLHAFMA
ncbi:HAD domain-containing protein [Caballeronia sp. GAOx1]|uniref:HAD domain-containing protein n=1 Tax=Caballeronia sp. GAOx1 TaxID=2921761 RepID=UPI002027C2DF|nr:HAD domain-containing protein [Caballeronia sp. GAOx1]